MPRIFTILILLIFTVTARAQTWEAGVTLGAAGYMGDLNPRNPVKPSGAAFGAYVKRNYSGYISAKAGFMHGHIAGADSTSADQDIRNRNLSFSTNLNELSLTAEFNFFEFRPGIDKHAFSPYVFLGLGVVNFNPRANYQGNSYDLQPLMTEGQNKPYSKTAMTIPYGVGVKYNFSNKLSLIADVGYRNPSTDYLDDVSGTYADKGKFANPVARALSDRTGERNGGVYTGSAGSQRGDLRSRDTYMFMTISISYTFITDHCFFVN
jgi:opacity protein-like surface antigen